MTTSTRNLARNRGIAFIGNYLPRACGIATFTHDLVEAVIKQIGLNQEIYVAAMNDIPEGYSYPDMVKFELRRDHLLDYNRAADFVNFSNVDVVCLQHEYGIYGGDHGSNILSFLRNVNRPVVVTCHTVLEFPSKMEKQILLEIAAYSDKLVVMNERAMAFLEIGYGISRSKIVCIPHGIHYSPFVDPNYYKDKFDVEGQKVLMTFGLLHRNKGIEYVIEALPQILKKHPQTTYFVLGATHPTVVREEGESYRLSLQRMIRELGVEDHVRFCPRFVELNELLEYLGATDIFITPYLDMGQITSGALVYAMGTGKAVVSTPYWHAKELLGDGRGIIVPPSNAFALATAVNDLLDDEIKLNGMRKRAYLYCQGMVWSSVAHTYLNLFDALRNKAPAPKKISSSRRLNIEASDYPAPRLEHVLRLCDNIGPAKHARYTLPDWSYGYSLDIAAATLVVACKFNEVVSTREASKLTEVCLTLFETFIGDKGHDQIIGNMDYHRVERSVADEESLGMAIWALGYVVWRGPKYMAPLASELMNQILPPNAMTSFRGACYAILGACNYLQSFSGAAAIKRFLKLQLKAVDQYLQEGDWIIKWGDADWPVAAQTYCVAARILDNHYLWEKAKIMIFDLSERTRNGTTFPVQDENLKGDELPITAATFIEALNALYSETHDAYLLLQIRSAVNWFLGENSAEAGMYDFSTGGCHDALTPSGMNRNQGTEATVYCLLAFLSLNRIAPLENSSAGL